MAAALDPSPLEGWLKAFPALPGLAVAALCLGLLLLLAAPRIASWVRGRKRPTLTPIQVEELLLGSGALVVDLRDAEAFRSGHIRGSLHVPFPEASTRFAAPDPAARRAMVLVDESDALAHRACEMLEARGFRWIYVLQGGMRAWRAAHRPLAR